MAKNMTHKFTKTEVWTVGNDVAPGTAVLDINGQPGVTVTGSGDYTTTFAVGPYTITGINDTAGGLLDDQATVAVDGAFRFPVAGASAATPGNTLVYLAADGTLTLTAGTDDPFGKVDRFIGETSATETSVWIGDFSTDAVV